MSRQLSAILSGLAIAGMALSGMVPSAHAQSASDTVGGLSTPWGEPNLQGIWNNPVAIAAKELAPKWTSPAPTTSTGSATHR